MSSIGWYLLIVLSCLHWSSAQSGKRRKLRLDLILAVGPAGGSGLEDDVKKTLKNLPDEYTLGKEFSRVAVLWSLDGEWDTLRHDLGFTKNATQFIDYVKAMDLTGTKTRLTGPDALLIDLQASLFSTIPDNSRARFVIFIYPMANASYLKEPHWFVGRTVISLAKEADFFVLVNGGDKDRLDKITADPLRLKRANGPAEFRQLLSNLFGNLTEGLIYNHSCDYREACLPIGGACARSWWTPRLPTSYFDCASIRSPPNTKPTGSCEAYECDQLCDAWWPAISSCTDETCGQPRKREGDPPWKHLKICPPTKRPKYQCGACAGFPDWAAAVVVVGVSAGIAIGTALAGHVVVRRRRIRREMIESMKEAGKGSKKKAGGGSLAVSLRDETSTMMKEKSVKTSSGKGADSAVGKTGKKQLPVKK